MNQFAKELQEKEKYTAPIPLISAEDVEPQMRKLLKISGGVRAAHYLADDGFGLFRIDYEDHEFDEAKTYQGLIDEVIKRQGGSK